MYARLCKKLSEEAPNFEPEDSPTCTFNRLLLKKCQDEFECRRQASEHWESEHYVLTPEEEEQRTAARRKMVGNLRFIGELGKLEIIKGIILHDCIQELLEKRRNQTLLELAEDIECLCQMMKTCGKVLDNPIAKNLMDQYFERMTLLSGCMELPSRIRFMLRDVLDLRACGWVPRKISQQDGPRTIQQVREEAARDLGVYIPPPNATARGGPLSPLSSMPAFFSQGYTNRTGMEDVFGAPPIGAVTLGTGPGVISSQPDKFSYETNGYSNNANRDQYRQRTQPLGINFGTTNMYPNKHFSTQNNFTRQSNQPNFSAVANKDLPPRFMKMLKSTSKDDVSLRPTSTMLLKPALHSNHGQTNESYSSVMPAAPPNQKPPPMLHKEPPIVIKQAPIEKSKANKKDKGPSKNDLMQKINTALEEFQSDCDLEKCLAAFKGFKVPERFMADAVYNILIKFTKDDATESGKENGGSFLIKLTNENIVSQSKLFDGIKEILSRMKDVPETSSTKDNLAGILSALLAEDHITLAGIADFCEGGQHFPLIFSILQCLHSNKGKSTVLQIFNDSKIKLMNMLPDSERTKDKLSDVLEKRELSFLYPLLRIQADLWKALIADPSPHVFYKHIKKNLDQEHHTAPSFINALFSVLVKYITQETTLQPDLDANGYPDKGVTEKEKDLLEKFKPVLLAFLHDRAKLQVVALYALQVFAHQNNFPKGLLVRWFVNLYDLEIIEEEAFMTWKEDLNDDYPGKGKALFQVNQWLTWLQETEEDEEEEEGES